MRSLRFRPPKFLHIVFLGFVFWFTTDLISQLFRNGGPPPVVSYIVFLAFFLGNLVIHQSQGFPAIGAAGWAQSRNVWLWLFFFLAWIQISFLRSSQSEIAWQRLITGVEMILVFMAFLWFLSTRRLNQSIGLLMVAVAIFGSALNIYDFFNPLLSAVPGRAAGLYVNPNMAGFILILAMSSGVTVLSVPTRWAFLTLVGVAVFLTFSRASWLVLVITLIWLAWQGHLGGKAIRIFLGVLAVFGAVSFVAAMLSGTLVELISASPIGNYLDANTLARLGGESFATDYSADERRAVSKLAISAFLDGSNPILGYGLGYTFEWEMAVSTHNVYLLFLVEGGLVGLAFFLSLLAVLWRSASGIGRLIVLEIAVHSFFDHNLLDSPGRIIFMAMVAAGVLNSGQNRNTPQSEKASIGYSPPPHHRPQHRRRGTFAA